MNLDVTVRAVGVLRVQIVLWTGGLLRADAVSRAVTSQAKLGHAAGDQQTRIRGTMRRVTRDAAVGFHRRMFVNKRPLLVCMTLDASRVGAGRESCLFELETAMGIVAITALHRAFEHLVVKRQVELVFRLAMTTETKLWFAVSEQSQIREAGLLRIRS